MAGPEGASAIPDLELALGEEEAEDTDMLQAVGDAEGSPVVEDADADMQVVGSDGEEEGPPAVERGSAAATRVEEEEGIAPGGERGVAAEPAAAITAAEAVTAEAEIPAIVQELRQRVAAYEALPHR